MKRLFAFAMSLGLVAAMAVPALANGVVVATHATGDVVRNNGSQTWHTTFDAHAPVDMYKGDELFKTRPAKGTASGERLDGAGYWTIKVTCAVSLGEDNGRVGFRFGGPTIESNISRPYIVLEVWDAGSPGAAGDTVRTFVEDSLSDACSTTYAGAFYDTMLEGNLVVHVAQ